MLHGLTCPLFTVTDVSVTTLFLRFCLFARIGKVQPQLLEDPRFASNSLRVEHRYAGITFEKQ